MTNVPSYKKHPDHVDGWIYSLEELVDSIGQMRYDKLAEFLDLLAINFSKQATSDIEASRIKLSVELIQASVFVIDAAEQMKKAWKICEPYMKENK